jgi:SOS response regulatory protein OraA/RecX
MGDMWMRTFVSLGKWEQEIKLKLQKKEFSQATILQLMDKFAYEVHDWESNRQAIEYQMHTLESRGKSKQAIKNLLGNKYRYFRDEIALLLEWMTDDSQLTKEIERYLPRYDISLPHEKQKFYQAILRKWFTYEDIKNWLKKRENQEN